MAVPNELVEEIRGILEQTIVSLKNVEGFLNIRADHVKQTKEKLELCESIIEEKIDVINRAILPKIDKNFSDKVEILANKLKKLTILLNIYRETFDALKKESSSLVVGDIDQLLHDVIRIEEIDFSEPIQVAPVFQSTLPSVKAGSIQDEIKARTGGAKSKQESKALRPGAILSKAVVDPTKWTESEIEGFQVFDELIHGWKLRDYEKLNGTREGFAIAWRKLSDHDRKKIRSGTWSEPIIKKIKHLGRSRFEDD